MKILKTIWESNYPEVVLQETFHGNLDMLRTAYGLFDSESMCLLKLSVILVEGLNTIHIKLFHYLLALFPNVLLSTNDGILWSLPIIQNHGLPQSSDGT